MNFTLIITVALTFFVFLIALKLHESYVRTIVFYNEVVCAMTERRNELEVTVAESIKLSSSFKTTISENKYRCGKDSTKECSLCNGSCIFRKENDI